ncbi:hypothetical protein ACFX11_038181 [Malus domestica]
MRLPTKSISYRIDMTWVILNGAVIITEQLYPSPLLEIKIWLSEDILKALMISEDLTLFPIKIVPSNFQSKDDCYQLEIMSRIVPLMGL